MSKTKEEFNVAVIGGGPAGIMAAIRANEKGARVVLLEKNSTLGKKLLITGGGRCNITQAPLEASPLTGQAEFNNKSLAEKLGKNGQFLLSALAAFGPKEVIDFFAKIGLKTKVERGGRVFPVSDRATDVLRVLTRCLDKQKVKVLLEQEVIGFEVEDNKITKVKTKEKEIVANSFILATGGKAYPGTGSTGQGYFFVKKMGHTIVKPRPALVPVETKEAWPSSLSGLALKNVSVSLWQNQQKLAHRFGEMLFTHFGVSGPIILDLSKTIGQALADGGVLLKIDLKPALDAVILDKRLQRDLQGNKNFKNYLPELIPQKLGDLLIKQTAIGPERKINTISKTERQKIIIFLKGLTLTVKGLAGFDQAIITSGGVDLKEIDSRTMRSKIIKNLFLAGEIIDLDGPTGGYNLQICWSTGHIAGVNCFKSREISLD